MTDPETTPAETNPIHGAAVIEVLERRRDHRLPDRGVGSIVLPNHLRINGVSVWASLDHPITIDALRIDPDSKAPFVVTMTLHARAVRAGDIEVSVGGPAAEPDGAGRGSVVEIPVYGEIERLFAPGESLQPPVVYLNGSALFLGGPIEVGELRPGLFYAGEGALVGQVTLPLLCRRFIVDDELIPPVKPEPKAPAFASGGPVT